MLIDIGDLGMPTI